MSGLSQGEGPDEKVPANGDLLFQKAEKQAEEIIANAKKNREGLGRTFLVILAKSRGKARIKKPTGILPRPDEAAPGQG